MLSWVKNNRFGEFTSWDPYPTSLRIVNWIKWQLAGNNFDQEVEKSLIRKLVIFLTTLSPICSETTF